MSTSASNERSMSNPLCYSSLGSVVTSDYVTPLTVVNSAHGLAYRISCFDAAQKTVNLIGDTIIIICIGQHNLDIWLVIQIQA